MADYYCAVCNSRVEPHPLNPVTWYCLTCDRPWFAWYLTIQPSDGPACPWPCPERSATGTP